MAERVGLNKIITSCFVSVSKQVKPKKAGEPYLALTLGSAIFMCRFNAAANNNARARPHRPSVRLFEPCRVISRLGMSRRKATHVGW